MTRAALAVLLLSLAATSAYAQTENQLAQSSEAQRTLDENMRKADEAYKLLQREREHEQMRDKSHDFPRIQLDKDMSVGGTIDPPEINVRRTY
jgi:hypothetical protein